MKTKYSDLTKARSVALNLGGSFLWKDQQIDTYFVTKAGKLKLRESGLNGSELLPYIKTETAELKRSDYARLPVDDPELVRLLFTKLLGQKTEIRKIREVYLIGNVRIHLDSVDKLGCFLEFEAVFESDAPDVEAREHQKVRELMQAFGVEQKDLIKSSYPELLARKTVSEPSALSDIKGTTAITID